MNEWHYENPPEPDCNGDGFRDAKEYIVAMIDPITDEKTVSSAFYFGWNENWWCDENGIFCSNTEVYAWMELPEPPSLLEDE
jgi:hypothetical protein